MTGRLTLCATPIGNLSDTSERLAATMRGADVIYAEDTRRTKTLLNALGVRARVESYFVGNEAQKTDEIIARLEAGEHVALVSDAGMPTVSDPGQRVVAAAFEAGAAVSVVPGPSAVTAAVAASGLSGDRFVFEGFLPRKAGERAERLASVANERRTVVLFAAPTRLERDLADLVAACGRDRVVVVARELTKLHEEIRRSTLGEAAAEWSERTPRGEFTLVLEGAPRSAIDLAGAIREVHARTQDGERMSVAVREVADIAGVGRRDLYQAVLAESRPDA